MDIKGVIKAHGLTINEVAERLGINRVTLTLTLKNNPTYSTMKRIADVVDCDVADFFQDEATHQEETFLAVVFKEGTANTFTSEEELRKWMNR